MKRIPKKLIFYICLVFPVFLIGNAIYEIYKDPIQFFNAITYFGSVMVVVVFIFSLLGLIVKWTEKKKQPTGVPKYENPPKPPMKKF